MSPEPQEDAAAGRARPDLGTERGRRSFIKVLNARLPTKRLIAQGVLRTEGGRIALCQLVYKQEWDLPGGIVDPGESPAECVVREVREELGLEVSVRGLLAVNWLPPYRGWDDALLCLFDLGEVSPETLDAAVLQRRELKAVHWADVATVEQMTAPYTAAMLAEVTRASTGPDSPASQQQTLLLENSTPRDLT